MEIALDGQTGAEYAELGIYDLLILDVMMPGLDGYEVTQKVRRQRVNTPILMLTAKSGVEDRIRRLKAGADYYLAKPFDTRELLACINTLLGRQQKQIYELYQMLFGGCRFFKVPLKSSKVAVSKRTQNPPPAMAYRSSPFTGTKPK